MIVARKSLFLIGPGYIGGSLLRRLKETRPDLELSALTRREDLAQQLRQMGIKPVIGSLDDTDIIKKMASSVDIVIHTATADHAASAFAVVEGIKARPEGAAKVIYIQTSGNDELVHSARGLKAGEEKTLSDAHGDEAIDSRIQPGALHRHVDGPLRQNMMNDEAEREHNVNAVIMMPPLIYGVGSEPWRRTSIQVPMLARKMLEKGLVTLPKDHDKTWNAVHVHDLVEGYLTLLNDLESRSPTEAQPSHYVFPTEAQPFLWQELFEAVVSEVKRIKPELAQVDPKVLDEGSFADFMGKDHPYTPTFVSIVFGGDSSLTRPDRLQKLGFQHRSRGLIHSVLTQRELEPVLNVV